jgi:hypothetical protein
MLVSDQNLLVLVEVRHMDRRGHDSLFLTKQELHRNIGRCVRKQLEN